MRRFFVFGSLILLTACNGFKSVKAVLFDKPPYERYIASLRTAELMDATMTKEWLSAGKRVFEDSVFVDIPFSESGFFSASEPQARSYRFDAKAGQVLTVEGTVKGGDEVNVFLDLFTYDEAEWDHIAYADSTLSVTYEFSSDETCVLRLQPELLADVWYSIRISLTPVLINPVYGASNKAIGSFYGAPRDNGKRKHEGVDIFAPKGTPVVAPTHGYITRVGNSGLGGKVVWMKDVRREHSYYFAHLDSQMVKPGMHVRQGHVLGLVGNTGNAKYTPSHLHFGIYQSGSKDPLHYIRSMEAAEALPLDTGFQLKPFRTRMKRTHLMAGPSKKLGVKTTLEKDTYVTVIGQSRDWYRVALPDGKEGYVLQRAVVQLDKGKPVTLDSTAVLLSEIHEDAVPVAELSEQTKVEILARYANSNYVVTEQGKAGWLVN